MRLKEFKEQAGKMREEMDSFVAELLELEISAKEGSWDLGGEISDKMALCFRESTYPMPLGYFVPFFLGGSYMRMVDRTGSGGVSMASRVQEVLERLGSFRKEVLHVPSGDEWSKSSMMVYAYPTKRMLTAFNLLPEYSTDIITSARVWKSGIYFDTPWYYALAESGNIYNNRVCNIPEKVGNIYLQTKGAWHVPAYNGWFLLKFLSKLMGMEVKSSMKSCPEGVQHAISFKNEAGEQLGYLANAWERENVLDGINWILDRMGCERVCEDKYCGNWKWLGISRENMKRK